MFTPDDANQLRESLAPLDLDGPPTDAPLVARYRNHYGLNFSDSELPVTHTVGYFTSGPFKLVCQYFAIPVAAQRGTVFLLHGYFDHAGIYGKLIHYCLRSGFSVVVPDFPGHGLSSGEVASIDSFLQYGQALAALITLAESQNLNQPWVMIGQSTGAAVAIDALLEKQIPDPAAFQRIVLLAPLLRPHRWRRSQLLFGISRHFLAATRRTFTFNSHDEAFLEFLREHDALQSRWLRRDWILAMLDYIRRFARADTSDVRLHIIQGTGDTTVDWRYNLPQLQKKFPRASVYMISGAFHHLANEASEYTDRMFSIIDQVLEGVGS